MPEHDVDELQPYERASNMPRELQRSLDPSARMQAGVDLAVTLIEGCDHAGLTLVQDGQITCGPGSDDVVAKADAIQDELGEGPCVDAARLEDRTIYVDDLAKGLLHEQVTVCSHAARFAVGVMVVSYSMGVNRPRRSCRRRRW